MAFILLGAFCFTSQPAVGEPSPVALLRTPQSSWLWSNPAPQGEPLEAVEFAGVTGFASGGDGTVLKSVDGGASWSALSSGTTEKLPLIQVLDPATVLVSGDRSLFESTDGGGSFKEIHSVLPCYECSSITSFSFLSATSGFVAIYSVFTKTDTLLWTENGGASFQTRTPVPLYAAEPGQIRFLSPNAGFALVSGENIGRVMRTTDGGRTWTIAGEGRRRLSHLTFPTPQVGYAVGEADTVLRSDDGGATWRAMPLRLPPGIETLNLRGISCASAESCLITTQGSRSINSGPVLRTTDGGTSATVVEPFAAYAGPTVSAISFVYGSSAVAVGGGGATALSTDAGAHFDDDAWRSVNMFSPYEEPPTQIRLGPSPQEAFLPGEHGQIAATLDGGQRWTELQLPTRRTIVDAAFPTTETWFAVDKAGVLYATSTGGRSWQHCGPVFRYPGAVLAPNAHVVVVTDEHGLWRSRNGCRTFTHLGGSVSARGRRRSLRSFELSMPGAGHVVNRHTMIVFGSQILESTDAGLHWTLVPRPVPHFVESISFLNARTGYVLAEGMFFFTADRGRRWRRVLTVAPEETHADDWPSISFSSVRDGFLATSERENQLPNIVFRTEDAGRSWIPEEMPNAVDSIVAASGTAYAASAYGDMFIARDGGYTGVPSRISLRIAGRATLTSRALARAHDEVTVRGSITPPISGARVIIARTTGSYGWTDEAAETDAHGRFSRTFTEVESTTWIDAYWTGSPGFRGAAAGPARLLVRPG